VPSFHIISDIPGCIFKENAQFPKDCGSETTQKGGKWLS
jgi:hypothetical protein